MSAPGQLEQLEDNNNNMDLQENSTSEVDELTRASDILKREGLDFSVLCTKHPAFEDGISKAVKERVELKNNNSLHHIPCNLGRQMNTFEKRCLHLKFSRNVSSPLLTSNKIKGEGGISINLSLVDGPNGEVVKSGPEAAAKVEILALRVDCAGHEGSNGNLKDFNNRIVTEMEGRNSILQGTTTLKLKEGISSINDLSFTQRAHWMSKSRWCLGAKTVNSFPGTTIEPAKTEPFELKDNRTKSYAKEKIPSLSDKVSRLKHIGKGRTKRLRDENIENVKHLLELLNSNPQRLQKIHNVSSNVSEEITEHANTCIFDKDAVCLYFDPNSQQKCGVVYNVIGQVKGLLKESQYFPMNMLSDDEQKYAQTLVVCSLDQRDMVSTYNDMNTLMECFRQTLGPTVTENPSQEIIWDSLLFDTFEQAGIPTNNFCVNCVGKSSPFGSHEQGLCSPKYPPSHYDEEVLHFMSFNNQPARPNPEMKPKLSWFIIYVSRLFLFVTRTKVRTLKRDHLNKRQRIS